tara:strand:+ start:1374 stop:1886 length:513 start_codon:yes stop_codon:yes gene_type:complete
MPDRITLSKRVQLGWGSVYEDLVRLGRVRGFDVYSDESHEDDYRDIWIYDQSRVRKGQYRIVANITLSKRGSFWHVDMVQVSQWYRGNGIARLAYSFLIRKGYSLQAGDSQSPGGRFVWNELAKDSRLCLFARKSPRSRVVDFPRIGKTELYTEAFDLYDSKAVLYAVAS